MTTVAAKPAEVVLWQKILCRLIAYMLSRGMPMELLAPRQRFLTETLQARNAEEALLAMLNACARTTKVISKINWPGQRGGGEEGNARSISAGAWISRLRGQRSGPGNVLTLGCLSFLDLSECSLEMIDLYGANLNNSDLERVSLRSACLEGATLRKANLRQAYLSYADLRAADLRDADLGQAVFRSAELQDANLRGANLQGARFEFANLQGASVKGASGANLKDAKLSGAAFENPAVTGKAYGAGVPLSGDSKKTKG